MEFSSPLATMQPQAQRYGAFGESNLGWRYAYEKQAHARASSSFNCGFNFEALSMKEGRKDYFNHKPVRGSSPTSTLVADLSQNLLIDQSPQNPTPRRALFSPLQFSTRISRESSTTPPVPSSSPGPGNDPMDISPLPHKAPFIPRTTGTTPVGTGGPSVPDDRPSEASKPSQLPVCLPGRRKSSLCRPTLKKGFSTTAITLNSGSEDTQSRNFSFGPKIPGPTPLFAVSEGLTSSPSPEKRPQSANSPLSSLLGPPKLKSPLQGLMGQLRSGSPGSGHVRKISAPSQRPRKQFRRSLSMTDNPADILKENKATYCSELDTIKDIDDTPQLPHFRSEEETIPRITKETMVAVLDGKYCHCFDRAIIIDCRFEYEYEGGHIDGAINFNSKEALAKDLFENDDSCKPQKPLLILHCEYSAHRAPIMAQFVRHRDRATNAHCYPALHYPELYILDGGYSSFFNDYRLRCTPQEYVTMKEKEHLQARRRGLGRVKQERQKLNRAQTFAFGQHGREADESPLAAERQCSSILMAMDTISIDPLDLRPAQSRRMASY